MADGHPVDHRKRCAVEDGNQVTRVEMGDIDPFTLGMHGDAIRAGRDRDPRHHGSARCVAAGGGGSMTDTDWEK